MKYTKDGVVADIAPDKVAKYQNAGWTPVVENVKAVDEVIRLKPPVKTKATVKVLDEATDNKGDE